MDCIEVARAHEVDQKLEGCEGLVVNLMHFIVKFQASMLLGQVLDLSQRMHVYTRLLGSSARKNKR